MEGDVSSIQFDFKKYSKLKASKPNLGRIIKVTVDAVITGVKVNKTSDSVKVWFKGELRWKIIYEAYGKKRLHGVRIRARFSNSINMPSDFKYGTTVIVMAYVNNVNTSISSPRTIFSEGTLLVKADY